MLKFLNLTKSFEIHTNKSAFIIRGVFKQEGHLITFKTKNSMMVDSWMELYVIVFS